MHNSQLHFKSQKKHLYNLEKIINLNLLNKATNPIIPK